jgi:hypothetical protein
MGKEGIREFAWWIAELTRRVMRDWYTGEFNAQPSKENIAGGGCVLVVDAKDAGIKNLVSTNTRTELPRQRDILLIIYNILLIPFTHRNSNSSPT